ncbi:MAG: 3'-5' exonuclease [Rhodothermales bacterium]
MFKTIQPTVWAFDIEWVPDPTAGKLIYGLDDNLDDRSVMEHMWAMGGGTEEEPRPFLKMVLCRIVSIAAIERRVRDDKSVGLTLVSLPHDPTDPENESEAEIISRFLDAVGQKKPQLVGFNSMNADIKILIQRAIVNGIEAGSFAKRPDKPWEGPDYFSRVSESSVDLMDIVSGWGRGSPSLNQFTTLSGIPGKFEIDGQQVADRWLEGKLGDIVAYNECDAVTTYLLWLRFAHFGGFFDEEEYEEEQENVRRLLREMGARQNGAHLLRYLAEWERLRDRVKSLP